MKFDEESFLPPSEGYPAIGFEVHITADAVPFMPVDGVIRQLQAIKNAALDLQIFELQLLSSEFDLPEQVVSDSTQILLGRPPFNFGVSAFSNQNRRQAEAELSSLSNSVLRIYHFQEGSLIVGGFAAGLAIALLNLTIGEDIKEAWKETVSSKQLRNALTAKREFRASAFIDSALGRHRTTRGPKSHVIDRNPDRVRLGLYLGEDDL